MSDKPKHEGREYKDASPEQLREELEEYIQHMLSHDPKKLEFALMVTGHGGGDGSTNVCSMLGGQPQTLARVILELMDELAKRDPSFAIYFLMGAFARMGKVNGANVQVIDMSKLDEAGGLDVENQVKELLAKFMGGGTPPPGSVH